MNNEINLKFNGKDWEHTNPMNYISYKGVDFIYDVQNNTWRTLYGDFKGTSVIEIYNKIKDSTKTKVLLVYFPIECGAFTLECSEVEVVDGNGCEYYLDNGNLILKENIGGQLVLKNTPQTKKIIGDIRANIKTRLAERRKVWEKDEKAHIKELKVLKKRLLKLCV